MEILRDNGEEVLALMRREDGGSPPQTVVSIFRFRYAIDEVTSSFYLTEEELRVLVRHVSQSRHDG